MTQTDPVIRDYLNGLPEREVPAHLWSRIRETRELDQRSRRKRHTWWGAAAAAVFTLALLIPLLRPAAQATSELDRLMLETRVLEERLGAQPQVVIQLSSGGQANYRLLQAQLTALDTALSSAYEGGARPEVLLGLWQQRLKLLTELVDVVETGSSPI